MSTEILPPVVDQNTATGDKDTHETPTLLLVDDEPSNLRALQRVFRREAYRVVTANNAEEALNLLAQQEVDVVVSDHRMPGMSGADFLKVVAQLYPTTARIILSAHADASTLAKALDSGAIYTFLYKPWDDELLKAQVREAFREAGVNHHQTARQGNGHRKTTQVVLDGDGMIVQAQEGLSDYLGISEQNLVGLDLVGRLQDRSGRDFMTMHWRQMQLGKGWSGEACLLDQHGSSIVVWLELRHMPGVRGKLRYYTLCLTAGSRPRKDTAARCMDRLFDPVSRLPSMTLMRSQLRHWIAMRPAAQVCGAVFLLDLACIARINSTWGYAAGDELLKAAADRLLQHIQERGLLARLQGDAFVMLIPEAMNHLSATSFASKLKLLFDEPLQLQGQAVHIKPDIGVSLINNRQHGGDDLIANARQALLEARQESLGGICVFDGDRHARNVRRFRLENDLYKALDQHELRIAVQPQFDTEEVRLVGAEMLLRWFHPELGAVSPVEFIPMAEANHTIIAIGEWVLDQALELLQRPDIQAIPGFKLGLNLSPRQLEVGEFDVYLSNRLSELDLDPGSLEVEVTEGLLIKEDSDINQRLQRIRKLGVGLALDDFGTGYASLGYLQKYQFDTIKIDRSFIQPLPDSKDSAVIVEAVLGLARGFGQRVIAEGVETPAQQKWLRQRQCDVLQGYLLGAPLLMPDFLQQFVEPCIHPECGNGS